MQVIIDILRGARTGQRLQFTDQSVITVGRDPQAHIALDPHQDILASTRHAEIRVGAEFALKKIGGE